MKQIDEIAVSTDCLAVCQTKYESRVSALEDDITPLNTKLTAMEKVNAELTAKVNRPRGPLKARQY